ncbi:hypothetical protein NM688_g7230 [Phlebia brevispora]|uniref:Uncharacterized protein n=1 Tax=Phlebia brevispora TaxID=194682 RepID=A0ACC1S7Q0_9APHY|nr:hypothetical protein NM688_g7230 [Phlebia brevispora]
MRSIYTRQIRDTLFRSWSPSVQRYPVTRQYSSHSALNSRLCIPETASQDEEHHAYLEQAPSQTALSQPSPRLTLHALLHAKMRSGDYINASALAAKSISAGISIRTATLEIMIRGLCAPNAVSRTGHARPIDVLEFGAGSLSGVLRRQDKSTLELRSSDFRDSGVRAAYDLLAVARERQHLRTPPMYDELLNACVRQGELVNGSLIYASLVMDQRAYQSQKTGQAQPINYPHSDTASSSVVASEPLGVEDSLTWVVRPPWPGVELLAIITEGVSAKFALNPVVFGEDSYLQEPLQALAILVSLMNEGHMHFGKLSSLFRAMYEVPRSRYHRVWITIHGEPKLFKAYNYFHASLMRMIKSLHGNFRPMVPPLDTRAYNTLLYYALRHRKSPYLAARILDHMCGRRKPVLLKPTVETFNILTSTGTAIGSLGISQAAMNAFQRARGETANSPGLIYPGRPGISSRVHDPPHSAKRAHDMSGTGMKKLMQEMQEMAVLSTDQLLSADAYTLASYIQHLPPNKMNKVADTLLYTIPELAGIDHPRVEQRPKGGARRAS